MTATDVAAGLVSLAVNLDNAGLAVAETGPAYVSIHAATADAVALWAFAYDRPLSVTTSDGDVVTEATMFFGPVRVTVVHVELAHPLLVDIDPAMQSGAGPEHYIGGAPR